MAKTLWEAYETVKVYYDARVDMVRLFEGGQKSTGNCRRFIYDSFDSGHKENAFSIPFIEEYNGSGKHMHTVSLYLMGGVLEDTFSSKICNGVKKALNNKLLWYTEEEFMYSWFLTCLYHDMASCIETKIPFNICENQKHLEYYLGKWNIKYTPFNHQPINRGAELNCYSEELIKNYFYYMANRGETDHGIIGGYLLFDRLKKNFNDNTNGHNLDTIDGYVEEHQGRSLRWRIEHPDHFAYVADAIICHNLWTRNKGQESDEYEQYGLDPLIIKDKQDKVNIMKWPLQFMLRLLDSLEPIKRFENTKPRQVLEKICISGDKQSITVVWDSQLQNQKGYDKWLNTIKHLEEWMDVRITFDDGENPHRACIKFLWY